MQAFSLGRAFSLIELVAVVVILGLIGAIALPRLARSGEGARAAAHAAELRRLAQVFLEYHAIEGDWPADSNSGAAPSELEGLLPHNAFGRPTPLGGLWDFEMSDSGVGAAVGTHFQSETPPVDLLERVDALLDDGDVENGAFRRLTSDRYYLVLEN